MPVKRRLAKARRELDSASDLQDLFYGPGTCLFNGEGYLGPHGDGRWRGKPDHVKAQVLAAMRCDWERHNATVMQAWHDRTEHELYIARQYHGDPAQPWALRQFGDPSCQ
ncbi:hypothetical protein ACUXST_000144 [Sphingomonas sp. F9_3S_D5_B_2]